MKIEIEVTDVVGGFKAEYRIDGELTAVVGYSPKFENIPQRIKECLVPYFSKPKKAKS